METHLHLFRHIGACRTLAARSHFHLQKCCGRSPVITSTELLSVTSRLASMFTTAMPPSGMHETGCKSCSPRLRCVFLPHHSYRAAVSFSRVRALANLISTSFCSLNCTRRLPLFQSVAVSKCQ